MADNDETALARIEEARKTRAGILNLSGLRLRNLPKSLTELTWLQSLHVSGNDLDFLPEFIGQLAQLRYLDLSHAGLFELPEEIGRLAHLKQLHLNDNPLTKLPESISLCRALSTLDISYTAMDDLSPLAGLKTLTSLDVSGVGMVEFPHSVLLPSLEDLYLAENTLVEVPEEIGSLRQLKSLFLGQNEMLRLPQSIGQLTRLEILDLSDNKLTGIPKTIGGMSQLRFLYLDGNELVDLPEELRSLTHLEQLYLHGNRSLGIPGEVLGPTWEAVTEGKVAHTRPADILGYYFRVRGGRRPLNEAKLILVGRGGVGKTSLVSRLVYDRFDPDEGKTEGIQITDWNFLLQGTEEIRLNIWDFGGQEIMHATHQFFLTQRSLYVLVLNGRGGGEDADAEYWLKLIESFGGDSPVIVVLNKIREHPFDLNRRALQQKYPICEFIKTDCEEGIGIEDLRKTIQRETDRLEHLRDSFPASWFSIKDKLAHTDEDYLSFESYRKLCEEHGESDGSAQEALAGYLHNLGIVLNYKDDPRLQDTHVLNPHWVTNGIYKILNSERLERQKGEIRLHNLAEVLDPDEYPVHMRRFVLDLMKKFDLCFTFPEDDCHYLIPELLDKQEPEQTSDFDPAECLNFRYHYPVLPEGLLPRFIVRTHTLSEGSPRWRTGVILAFEGSRALVKADIQERKVFISVLGPASGRRSLLAIIRSDFERIHADIRHLKPQEMVPLPDYPNVVVPYQKLRVMEQQNIPTFPEVVGSLVVDVDVHTLLNGVDLEGTRRRGKSMDERRTAIQLFFSYSHRDEALRNELETHLKLLQRQGVIDAWNDRKIGAGEEWKKAIDENLERADVVLLLISADFIASDYCYDIEMGRALERHDRGEARVIPVIVRDVDWTRAPFAKLQALPKDGKAVRLWEDRDSAWRNVAEGIRSAVEQLRRTPGRP